MEAAQRRPRDDHVESVVDERMGRTQAERSDGRRRPLEVRVERGPMVAIARASGEQDRDRLPPDPAQREAEDRRTGLVEPLDVVDGEGHRPSRRERAKRRQQRDPDRSLVQRHLGRRSKQECRLDRGALRFGKRGDPVVQHVGQQVAQR